MRSRASTLHGMIPFDSSKKAVSMVSSWVSPGRHFDDLRMHLLLQSIIVLAVLQGVVRARQLRSQP